MKASGLSAPLGVSAVLASCLGLEILTMFINSEDSAASPCVGLSLLLLAPWVRGIISHKDAPDLGTCLRTNTIFLLTTSTLEFSCYRKRKKVCLNRLINTNSAIAGLWERDPSRAVWLIQGEFLLAGAL